MMSEQRRQSQHEDDPALQEVEARLHEALALSAAEIAPPAGLREQILERARKAAQAPEHTLTVFADQDNWKTILPGVHMKHLYADQGARSFLLRLDPGAVLPGHPHDGDEECMVLSGELYLGDFRVAAGDYHLARRGSRHGDIRAPNGALIFLRSKTSAQYDAPR